MIPGVKTPPTPLINNILFGEKLDMGENSNIEHKYAPGHLIENYQDVVGDIVMPEFDLNIKIEDLELEENTTENIVEVKQEVEEKTLPEKNYTVNATNFYCKMCSKKFNTLRQLKRHADLHLRRFTCDLCGTQSNDKTNFTRHVQRHMVSMT